jgi:formate-dependent nitrite reductase membrane component NrfD
MRRVGVLLLAVGLCGFLLGTAQAARPGRGAGGWETARWLLVGTAVIGLVFTVLPGKRE